MKKTSPRAFLGNPVVYQAAPLSMGFSEDFERCHTHQISVQTCAIEVFDEKQISNFFLVATT
jgi:hypothetical protein